MDGSQRQGGSMMGGRRGRRYRGRVGLLVLTAITACGLIWGITSMAGASSSPSPAAEKLVLRVGMLQDIDSLNPFAGVTVAAYEMFHLNYDMLTGYAPNGDVRPEIADSWEASEDGLTWTFKIHPGITWQDGEPLTASDVAFTFNYIIDNELAAYTSSTVNIEEAVAIDDATVEFRLTKPKATMLRLWIPIVPEHIWSEIPGDKAATFNSEPPVIGSGPFQTIEVKKGSYIRFAANKNYWKGAPKVDEVILEVYTNQDTMAMDLKSGAIDVAVDLPAPQFDAMKDEPGITAEPALFRYFVELAMNVYDSDDSQANPVLRDLEFRKAISWAVDKQKVVDTALNGYGDVGQSIIGPFTDYAWEPSPEQTFGYDMAKAAQLLDEAGYTDADGDGIREDKQGKPIELRLWTRSESPEQQRAGKLIAGSFEELGLKIVLSVENDGAINDGIYAYKGDNYAPDFDLFIWGWGGTADPGYQLGSFITSQIEWWNDACWSNAEYDSLYEQQDAEMDTAAREQQVQRMQEVFYEDAPYVVLYYPQTLIAYNSDKWEGWVPYPGETGRVVLQNDNIDTYLQVQPKAAATETDSGSSSTLWIVVGALIAIIVIVLVVVLLRRGGRSETTA
jgi:peptide/nickel transport system substrate-binding protein